MRSRPIRMDADAPSPLLAHGMKKARWLSAGFFLWQGCTLRPPMSRPAVPRPPCLSTVAFLSASPILATPQLVRSNLNRRLRDLAQRRLESQLIDQRGTDRNLEAARPIETFRDRQQQNSATYRNSDGRRVQAFGIPNIEYAGCQKAAEERARDTEHEIHEKRLITTHDLLGDPAGNEANHK
jgi:hypothetical protein